MKSSHERLATQLLCLFLKSRPSGLMQPIRIRMAIAKVEAVKVGRATAIGVMLFQLFKLFLYSGFVLLHIGLFFFLDMPLNEKGLIFMLIGGGYFLLMLIVMMTALSQKRWMKMSGADQAVINALRK